MNNIIKITFNYRFNDIKAEIKKQNNCIQGLQVCYCNDSDKK